MLEKIKNAKALYLEGIRDGHYEAAVNAYTGDRYTQHSTGVKDGRDGFIEFFSEFVKRNPERDIQIVRGWEDGNYVFLHVYQNIGNGATEWVTTDFFDTDSDNKIIEHWDVIAPFYKSQTNSCSNVSGPSKVVDLEKTQTNKELVRKFLRNAFMTTTKIHDDIHSLLAPTVLSHNTSITETASDFLQWIDGDTSAQSYEEIVLCVGSGNFVATLSKATYLVDNAPTAYAQVDIFRCENDRIAEHWSNTEPVPESDVNGGKF